MGSSQSNGRNRRILLNDIKTIAFNRMLGHHLEFSGGNARYYYSFYPKIIECYNIGDNEWECESELDYRVNLGKTEILCEGYDYEDDPFIVEGSCRVNYGKNFFFCFPFLLLL